MSQRTKSVNEEIVLDIQLKINLEGFSNHDGFKEGQIERAIEEFKEKIKEELIYKIDGHYYQQEFLTSVDYVEYIVSELKK